ncbi:spore germination protein [Fontibacillus phaseoli]|uniref:Spore germination protein n=1 Tax=Fontibacillus phaseoli TaxID=1416533 RepID=A0A369BFJ4_9BACL|nr:endospore germination permease [Fontibacillus phaseoli]RCX20313.1 spore germination protein [Fontibacillus phaseoli]
MNRKQKISTIQTALVVASTTFGVGVLSFPRVMAQTAGSGAPLMTVLGLVLALFGLWLVTTLGQRFRGQTIFDYGQALIGRWPASAVNLILFIFFTVSAALSSRQFGDVLSIVVFRRTPIEVSIILILLTTAFSCRRDIVKFSYIHIFYFPFIFVPYLVIMLVSLQKIDVLNLLPLTGNNSMKFIPGITESASLFLGSFIITILIPHMQKPKSAMKSSLFGIIISGGAYLVMIFSVLGIYGVEETKVLLYPTLELSRSISLGGGVLERFDALFIVIWFITVYTTLYSSYYLASYAFSRLFRFTDQRLTSSFLLPFMLAIALLPLNVFQTRSIVHHTEFTGLLLLTSYPLLLKLISLFRRKGGIHLE